MFVIGSNVGGSERWQVTKFISGLKHEIAKRLEMDVKFRPSISLKVIVKYALEYEKIVSVFEKILVCEYKKNESVTIIEVVEQKVEVKSFHLYLGILWGGRPMKLREKKKVS